MKSLKNQQIADTIKETKERRSSLVLKSYSVKIDESKISKDKRENLGKVFLEAKWVYNNLLSLTNRLYEISPKDLVKKRFIDKKSTKRAILNGEISSKDKIYIERFVNILNSDSKKSLQILNSQIFKTFEKISRVQILNKDGIIESRNIEILSSQMKQSLIKEFQKSIKGLSVTKLKGRKVGKLKFKSKLNSIDLKQFGSTYRIINDNYISIQNLGKFKVSGLKQLKNVKEFSNAKLIRKASGFYLNITCYEEQDKYENYKRNGEVGIDFGIKDQLTLSNGTSFNFQVPESKRLKKLQRKYFKKVETHKRLKLITNSKRNKVKSKNGYKLQLKIQKEYERITNQRKQVSNKILNYLKTFDKVIIQDENIKAWHSNGNKSKSKSFGKGGISRKVQNSGIGGIIGKIKLLPTHILVDKFQKTTQVCSCCGNSMKMDLGDRIYKCDLLNGGCGAEIDRDINSAYNILQVGLNKIIPIENRDINFNKVLLKDLLGNISLKNIILS